MLAALILDFDGVIVDTEPLHHKALLEVLTPEGIAISWRNYLDDYIGFDDRDALKIAFLRAQRTLSEPRLADLVRRKAEVFARLAAQEGTPAYPGAVALIRQASGRVPLGLCSGAVRSDIDPVLAGLGLAGLFDAVVTAEDVPISKPDPASYDEAARRLESRLLRSPARRHVLAVEDTPAGIAAARGAGLSVLAVTHTHPAEKLSEATAVVNSLTSVTLEGLAAMLA